MDRKCPGGQVVLAYLFLWVYVVVIDDDNDDVIFLRKDKGIKV